MQEKIVSYDLCKELHDLGFECKTNIKEAWVEFYPAIKYEVLAGEKEIDYTHTQHILNDKNHDFHLQTQYNDNRKFVTDYKSDACGELIGYYQAYDCWDMLMWLQKNTDVQSWNFTLKGPGGVLPQNALAKAVIEILKEKL